MRKVPATFSVGEVTEAEAPVFLIVHTSGSFDSLGYDLHLRVLQQCAAVAQRIYLDACGTGLIDVEKVP